MRIPHWARIAVLALLAPGVTTFAQTFKAGAGRADIQIPPSMFPVAEFSGQHDPVSTRVLLLDDGSQRIALLTIDTPSIQEATAISGWKAIVSRVAGTTTDNALVIATHDTAAPHITPGGAMAVTPEAHGNAPGTALGPPPGGQNGGGPPPPSPTKIPNAKAYAKAVDDAVESAATKAVANLQPAQVGFGLGTSHVNISSNLLTPKGWANGLSDDGFTDPSLALIRFSSLDGKPLAWLMDYAVRPAVMERSKTESGGDLVSGDLIGAARTYLEKQYGSSATAIFLMGAASDQQPLFTAVRSVYDKDGNASRVDIHEAGFTLVDLIGERLGSDAVRVNEAIKTSATPTKLRLVRQSVEVGTQARQPGSAAVTPTGQKVAIPFLLLQIGDVLIVGAKHELDATTGVQIRNQSPYPHTIFAAMVDGSNGGLSDMTAYDRGTNGSTNSFYVRGSAEALVAAIQAQLKQLHDAP